MIWTIADIAHAAMESGYACKSAIAGQLDGPEYRVLVLPYKGANAYEVVGDAQAFISDRVPITVRVEVRLWVAGSDKGGD